MAQLQVTIVGEPTGPLAAGITVTVDISGDNSDRLLAYIMAVYGVDQDGVPRTPQQAIAVHVKAIAEDLFGAVEAYERRQAAVAAVEAVAGIPFVVE